MGKKISSPTTKPFEPFTSEPEVIPQVPEEAPAPPKPKRRRGRNNVKDPLTGAIKSIPKDEYNHQKIRERAQSIAAKALNALEEILDPTSEIHKIATPAQLISAASTVLDRAGDRPATGEPDKSTKVQSHIVIDRSVLPKHGTK